MELNYEFIIKDKIKFDDTFSVRWELIGTDKNGNSAKFFGATPSDKDIDENSIDEVIIPWLTKTIEKNKVYKKHIDDELIRQINQSNVE
jgi:hypothetical protein